MYLSLYQRKIFWISHVIFFLLSKKRLVFLSWSSVRIYLLWHFLFTHHYVIFLMVCRVSKHNNVVSRHLLFYKLKNIVVLFVSPILKPILLFLTMHVNNGEKLYLLNAEWLPSARQWQHNVIIIFYYVFKPHRLPSAISMEPMFCKHAL